MWQMSPFFKRIGVLKPYFVHLQIKAEFVIKMVYLL